MIPALKIILVTWTAGFISCTGYTPKPRGYFRIEPPAASYRDTSVSPLPFAFSLSDQAFIQMKTGEDTAQQWFDIRYPGLHARIYCSYLSGTEERLMQAYAEFLRISDPFGKQGTKEMEPAWSRSDGNLYGEFFYEPENIVSPIRFVIFGDSSKLLRGMLFYDGTVNPDSIAPVNDYLRHDLIHLIRTFKYTD